MKTPIVVLTGFLGSGKTTLMQYLLHQFSDKKVAVLVNDFGEVPVDAAVLSGHGIPDDMLYEVNGGSIFCACLKDSFALGLKALVECSPDLILVEASGMADPSGISPMIRNAGLADVCELMCTLCVFDAIKSLKLAQNLTTIERQVSNAHYILLNKIDIAPQKDVDAATAYIREKNNRAIIFPTTHCRFDVDRLKKEMENPFAMMPSLNTSDNRPDAFTVESVNGPIDAFLNALEKEEDLLRVKGCLTENGRHYYISDTGAAIEKREEKENLTPVVVITMQDKGEGVQNRLKEAGFLA
ncbi:GTP-binding protein [Desulfoluna sp.]|uniref:GTP-binding protein n=1 Tax=Desulfoluna sp. TaxID=2045199 RepID=UPI0026140F55|nr:GTP-binding protein [Desulfoluna sp.]